MKQLNVAYDVLSNDEKRKAYDEFLQPKQNTTHTTYKSQPRANPNQTYEYKKADEKTQTYGSKRTYTTFQEKESIFSKIPGFVYVFVIVIIFVIAGHFLEDGSPESSTDTFNQPILSTPTSGISTVYTTKSLVSPFKIKTPSGDQDYYIKLVDVNTEENDMTIFVNGGDTVEASVPSGSYEVRYAVGINWYGVKYIFGPETQYYKTDDTFQFSEDSGWNVELIPQIDGNLETDAMSAEGF